MGVILRRIGSIPPVRIVRDPPRLEPVRSNAIRERKGPRATHIRRTYVSVSVPNLRPKNDGARIRVLS